MELGMNKLLDDVRAFLEACDQPALDKPQVPPYERQKLRWDLNREEFDELWVAWCRNDLVGIADAIADLIYVLVGMALEYGIPLDRVWDAVQRSNMAKIDPVTGKVRKREDGKILKPEGWQPPDIAGILKAAA
jgi:predicted HAD superfamily Cof-like phosphohydrolase